MISLYDWHSKMYKNVLVDISDTDAQNRLGTKANHIAWIAGSLVQGRFALANMLHIDLKQTSDKLFENFKGIQDGATYPSLEEYKKDWDKITPVLKDKILHLTEEELNGKDPFEMPGGEYTLFDSITFCTDRESYCIGQIALFRRLLGYDSMKYE
ncbi:hypothetical protein BH10BAC3_BH10BAC3_38320 [soil metagenome]